jgi:hypothetical protein
MEMTSPPGKTYRCFLCGLIVDSLLEPVYAVILTLGPDRADTDSPSQELFVHEDCLRAVAHPSIPLYLFDLGDA